MSLERGQVRYLEHKHFTWSTDSTYLRLALGINLSFAGLLLSKGCNVLFADLKLRPEAEALVNEHQNPPSADLGKAVFQETDVTEWKQLERMFTVAESNFGAVDIVVPGAGIYEPVGLPICVWDRP